MGCLVSSFQVVLVDGFDEYNGFGFDLMITAASTPPPLDTIMTTADMTTIAKTTKTTSKLLGS